MRMLALKARGQEKIIITLVDTYVDMLHSGDMGDLIAGHRRWKQVYSGGGGKNFSNICYAGTL